MDWQTHLKATAAWLVAMSRNPGSVDHARHRARELMESELYADLPRLMREAQSASSSPESPSAKDARASAGSAGSPDSSPPKRP